MAEWQIYASVNNVINDSDHSLAPVQRRAIIWINNDMWLKAPTWTHLIENHFDDVIMGAMASQITSLTIVYLTVYSDADHRKHQSSASLAFVRGIHRRPMNFPHKWPVTGKMSPFDDVFICIQKNKCIWIYALWYGSHFSQPPCALDVCSSHVTNTLIILSDYLITTIKSLI